MHSVFYQKLLEHGGKEITGEMRERILHNQGCAYSYLFQMDKALDCFLGKHGRRIIQRKR